MHLLYRIRRTRRWLRLWQTVARQYRQEALCAEYRLYAGAAYPADEITRRRYARAMERAAAAEERLADLEAELEWIRQNYAGNDDTL